MGNSITIECSTPAAAKALAETLGLLVEKGPSTLYLGMLQSQLPQIMSIIVDERDVTPRRQP